MADVLECGYHKNEKVVHKVQMSGLLMFLLV